MLARFRNGILCILCHNVGRHEKMICSAACGSFPAGISAGRRGRAASPRCRLSVVRRHCHSRRGPRFWWWGARCVLIRNTPVATSSLQATCSFVFGRQLEVEIRQVQVDLRRSVAAAASSRDPEKHPRPGELPIETQNRNVHRSPDNRSPTTDNAPRSGAITPVAGRGSVCR